MNNTFADLQILLSGQLITSRTETLEEYLKEKVNLLGVIGITSSFALKNFSRCTLYDGGKVIKQFSFPSFRIGNAKWYKQPLLFVSFLIYFVFIIYSAFRFKKKFDVFIGVACFSTFGGIFLKKLGIAKNLIYYSIDYYPLPLKWRFNSFVVKTFYVLDKWCVKNADITWHISSAIAEGRLKFAKVSPGDYKHIVAPLTYASRLRRFVPLEKVEHYTIGFVGSLSENQGLQLLIKAMPEIIKELPQAKVRIIGRGPYGDELKSMVREAGLNERFLFHGFIEDDNAVLDILSHCAIGIATWTSGEDNNILYADPGKPKLYAFCGLPTVITNRTLIAKEINERRAGISINYNKKELIEAVIAMLTDEEKLKEYKINASKFAQEYSTEKIFDSVFLQSMRYLK